ncbi:ROK family protein, partial [Flavihumibacter sediminis]|nr:ROK family protein [Flavihumibacter sediminis]
ENVSYQLENTTEALDLLIKLIETFLSEASVERSKILGVCINLSGRINHRSGYSYSYFHFQEKPLTEIIEEHIGIRTFLENDSRAMAYGEFRCGSVSNEKNVLYVYLD